MTNSTGLDPSTRFVRSLDGNYFMVREAAEILKVKHTLLRTLLKDDPDLGPSFCAYFGKVKIYLYTQEDIERIGKYLVDRRKVYKNTSTSGKYPGRPQKWTPEQRKYRQRLYTKNLYYKKRLASQIEHDLDTTDTLKIINKIERELETMQPIVKYQEPASE